MSIKVLSSFPGNFLSGYLGTYYEKISYQSFFVGLALLGLAAGVAIFALQARSSTRWATMCDSGGGSALLYNF